MRDAEDIAQAILARVAQTHSIAIHIQTAIHGAILDELKKEGIPRDFKKDISEDEWRKSHSQ